ncbi:hypothetical protein Aduo_019071 [Ancylostoma duodenale]
MITFRVRRSNRNDFSTIDFRCPGVYRHQGQDLKCSLGKPWSEIVPDAPAPDWIPNSTYECGRAVTIMQQNHIPDSAHRDLLLDTSYVTLSVSGLAVAYSYFRKNCIHISTYLRRTQLEDTENHLRRHREEPFNVAKLVREARGSAVLLTEWKKEDWARLPKKPVIVLLPEGFEEHCPGFTSGTQKAFSYRTPGDIQLEWFGDEPSAIVLFSPLREATLPEWCVAWTTFMEFVSEGTDLFCLPSPRDQGAWGAGVDMIRDLAEETLVQRPSLVGRINYLFPVMGPAHEQNLPCEVLGTRLAAQPHFLPSAAKKFLNATCTYYGIRLKLEPYRRIAELNQPPDNRRREERDQEEAPTRAGEASDHRRPPRDRPRNDPRQYHQPHRRFHRGSYLVFYRGSRFSPYRRYPRW